MANGYFGGAPTAFQGGQEFGAMQRRRILQENALAALIGRYGPEAADPQSAAMLQTIEQRGQLHPLAVAEAERSNAAQAELVNQHGAIAGDPNAQARDMALRLQAARRGANVLAMTKQNKGDLGKAFDFVVPALSAIGISPDNFAAIREQIISDPDNVDELVALLRNPDTDSTKGLSGGVAMRNNRTGQIEWVIPTESGYRSIPGYTPAAAEQGYERAAQGRVRLGLTGRKLTLDEAKARGFDAPTGFQIWEDDDGTIHAVPLEGSQEELEREEKVTQLESTDRKFLQSFGTVSAHADVVARNANRAMDYFDDAQGGIILRSLRLGTKLVPGTQAYDANAALQSIKNNISIDELQRMRQSSPTGGAMGNVSNRDIEILQGALGRLETQDDPERLVEDINFIINEYNRIVGFANQDAQRAQNRLQTREQRRTSRPSVPARSTAPVPPAANEDLSTLSDEELLRRLNGGR